MEDEIPRCNICGEPATKAITDNLLLLCNNVVCYQATMELINTVLEKAEGAE